MSNEPIILSHTRQRCKLSGDLIDTRIERCPGQVPEAVEHVTITPRRVYEAQILSAATGAFAP